MRLRMAALAVLVLVTLAGCNKSAGGDGVASVGNQQPDTAASEQPAGADGQKFAQCMRDNGIDMPDPDPNGGGGLFGGAGPNATPRFNRNSPEFQKAMEACEDKLPFQIGGGATR